MDGRLPRGGHRGPGGEGSVRDVRARSAGLDQVTSREHVEVVLGAVTSLISRPDTVVVSLMKDGVPDHRRREHLPCPRKQTASLAVVLTYQQGRTTRAWM